MLGQRPEQRGQNTASPKDSLLSYSKMALQSEQYADLFASFPTRASLAAKSLARGRFYPSLYRAQIIIILVSAVLWIIRIVLYGGAAFVGLGIIMPAIGGGILGVLVAAPTASLALAADIWISARLRKEPVEQNVARRVMILDYILSSEKDRQEQLPDAEVEEVLPPERKNLPPGL